MSDVKIKYNRFSGRCDDCGYWDGFNIYVDFKDDDEVMYEGDDHLGGHPCIIDGLGSIRDSDDFLQGYVAALRDYGLDVDVQFTEEGKNAG